MKLDCIGVVSSDMAGTVAFYRLLGFDFPAFTPEEQHLEAITPPGAVRLMIDRADLATRLIGDTPRPANTSAFGLLCDSPAEVDRVAAAVAAAGHTVRVAPWDAFWGQRYATVADPDGHLIDLFAPLG